MIGWTGKESQLMTLKAVRAFINVHNSEKMGRALDQEISITHKVSL